MYVLGFCAYIDNSDGLKGVTVDGGFYTRTKNNVPLIGASAGGVRGAFVCGGLGGVGIMASQAAGELLAKVVGMSTTLPEYAAFVAPGRYRDPNYVDERNDASQL